MKQISTDKAPAAIGPYSQAIAHNGVIFVSGQLPIDPLTNELVPGGIGQQTHQVMQNILAILEEMGLETRHIVKTTVFLQNMGDFQAMNEVYASYFDEPYPARSCVQVAALPKGAMVEIECLVIDTLKYEQARNTNRKCEKCEGC